MDETRHMQVASVEETIPEGMEEDQNHAPSTDPTDYAMVLEDLQLLSGDNPILRSVSVAVPKRQFLGILGESGAGKTTLLRLIARKLDESVLTINGTGRFPTEIWFIAQEDVLYEYDTPLRVVTFLHELLYGQGAAAAEEKALELLEKVRFPRDLVHQTIGSPDHGLSVGSRRLLNVALALCAEAKVILLDEPTTGLDSSTAANLCSVLHEICRSLDCTAICTIHQPSDEALSHFDEVIVMSEGQAFVPRSLEEMCHQGEAREGYSRAELYLLDMKERRLSESTLPRSWSEEQRRSCLGTETFASQLKRLGAIEPESFFHQFYILLRRFWQRNWINFFALRFRVLLAIGLGLLLGYCYWQVDYHDPRALRDAMGFFMALTSTTFVPIVISAGIFPSEKPSFIHEMAQSKRYSLAAYVLARSVMDLVAALLSSVGSLIMGGMFGIQGFWGRYWFSFLLQSLCSDSFGLVMSVKFPPAVTIAGMIPGIGFVSVLLGTGIASPPSEGVGWIFHSFKWLSFFKYGFHAIANDQLQLMSGTCDLLGVPRCVYSNATFAALAAGLEVDGFASTYGFQWMVLGIIYLAFRLALLLLLRSLVSGAKFTYKAATNWEAKKAADEERLRTTTEVLASEVTSQETDNCEPREQNERAVAMNVMDPRSQNGSDEGAEPLPHTPARQDDDQDDEEPTGQMRSPAIDTFVIGMAPRQEFHSQLLLPDHASVNGSASGSKENLTRHGSELGTEGSFMSRQPRKRANLELRWDVEVVAGSKQSLLSGFEEKLILKKQLGCARSGEVLAILGPAQSGKTALLKTLSWQLPIAGFVACKSSVNVECGFAQGQEITAPDVRFVYQHDSFVPGDTVDAAIIRQLQFSMKVPPEKIESSCASIVKAMGLSHVADKKASEISGGQLRRLSIACQLAHRPKILVLDEPTSGLDSELALEALKALRAFAKASGTIVVCTLNQPGKRLLPEVDQFLYLSQGAMVFQGSFEQCIEFFDITQEELESRAQSDIILDRIKAVERGDAPPFSAQKAEEVLAMSGGSLQRNLSTSIASPLVKETTVIGEVVTFVRMGGETIYHPPGGFSAMVTRVKLLVKRNYISRLEYPSLYLLEVVAKFIVFNVFMSLLFLRVDDPFYTNRFALIFIILASNAFVAFIGPIVLFSFEATVFERETRAGDYSAMTYQLARWVFELPAEVMFSVVGTIICFYIVGFEGNLGIFILMALLNYFAAIGVGSALAVIPLPLTVNCGFGAFTIVAFFLGSDLVLTPHQIGRMYIVHALEVINPVRQALILDLQSETEASFNNIGSRALVALGLDRPIDTEEVAWGLLAMTCVMYRLIALFAAWLLVFIDRRKISKMHS